MGVIYDYFRAPSDTVALSIFDEQPLAPGAGSAVDGALGYKGIDPQVVLTKLAGLLSGVSYEEMLFSGIPYDGIAQPELISPEDSDHWLVRLSDQVRDLLAAADDAALAEAAPLWAGIEEFGDDNDLRPDEVLPWMQELCGLARRARQNGEVVYCSICL